MRNDLLAARASVDWAVAQLPAFQSRLDAWLKGNIDVVVKELPADTPNNVILAMEKEPLPLAFQVEAGRTSTRSAAVSTSSPQRSPSATVQHLLTTLIFRSSAAPNLRSPAVQGAQTHKGTPRNRTRRHRIAETVQGRQSPAVRAPSARHCPEASTAAHRRDPSRQTAHRGLKHDVQAGPQRMDAQR